MENEKQKFNGRTYFRYPNAPRLSDRLYFRHGGTYIHRAVWEFHHGPIPPEYQIHHKDGNPANNELDNLELVARKAHIPTHHRNDEQRKAEKRETMQRVVRPKADEWHGSEAGRAWHSAHAAAQWATAEPTPTTCDQCGKEYLRVNMGTHARFCSNACKSAYRRATGVDNVTSSCPQCGGSFTHDRYIARRYCSRGCANRARCGYPPTS